MIVSGPLWDLGVRIAGVGVLVTGLEYVAAIPEISLWRGKSPAVRGAHGCGKIADRFAAYGLAILGSLFEIRPGLALHYGGIIVAVVLGYVVLRVQPAGDGADVMLAIICLGIGLQGAACVSERLIAIVDASIVVNVVFAYFLSGLAKVRVPAWRNGRQIALVLNSEQHGSRFISWYLLDHSMISRTLAWSTIGLETSCPLAVVFGGWILIAWVLCALTMHIAIAFTMGLGRFFWSFGAAVICLLAIRNVF